MVPRLWNIEEKFFNQIDKQILGLKLSAEDIAEIHKQQARWEPVTVSNGVAVINVYGVLENRIGLYSWYSKGTTYSKIIRGLQEASDNPEVETILLNVDSPGGESDGISDVITAIKKSSKKIIAFVSGKASSAAYWIASACDEIIMAASSFCGSIGCFISFMDYTEMMKAMGIEELIIKSKNAPNKNPDPKTEEGKQVYQKIVDDVEDLFISNVAEGRNVTSEVVIEKFGKGTIFIASDAISLGMADRIGSFEEVYKEYKEDEKLMTIEELRKDYPAVAQSLIDEGITLGAEKERTRILDLKALAKTPSAASIIETAITDGKTTAKDAALMILEAQGKTNQENLEAITKDGQEVPHIQNGESDDPKPESKDGSEQDTAFAEFEKYRDQGGVK